MTVGTPKSRCSAIVLTLALAIIACSANPEPKVHVPPASVDGPLTAEALSFGEIVLPLSARVLAVNADRGINRSYRLAIEVPPDSVATLLSGSNFTEPLLPGRRMLMPALSGFDPPIAADVESAQDRLPVEEGRRANGVTREVLVEQIDPARSVVHFWLFVT